MNIKYKILWVENEEDWIESIEDEIKELVESYFFEYYRDIFHNKPTKEINYNAYDLILMDLNLKEEPNGDVLIKQIRDQEVYTDVIFYSSDGIEVIKSKAAERNLEGVYFSNRRPNELFVTKVRKVIESTIKKIEDLNNLRGLVMAEVSGLDELMYQLIIKYYNSEERINAFHRKITTDREKSIRKSLIHTNDEKCDKLCSLNWRDKDITDLHLESSQRARAISHISFVEDEYKANGLNFYDEYFNEILQVRNELAHCVSSINDGVEVLNTIKGGKTYTKEKFKEIRRNIIKYNTFFSDLNMKL